MLKKIVKKVIHHKSPLDAYQFHIDEVSKDKISGWAHKIGEGLYTANIEVRHNNIILFTAKANIHREDLKAAEIGTGQYGFSINPQEILTELSVDSIDIFIDGLKANDVSFPLAISATEAKIKNTVEGDESSIQPSAQTHKVHVDHSSIKKVIGWAKKHDSVTHRSLVELRVGKTVIGRDTADTYRESIQKAGIGDGCYCFEIIPSVHLFPSPNISCDLYLDGKKSTAASIQLSVTDKALELAKFSDNFSNELENFNDSVNQELKRLTHEIETNNDNAVNVAITEIASLSVRMNVIEQILTKYISHK